MRFVNAHPWFLARFFSGICKENNAKTCPRTNPVLCFFFGRFYQYDPHGIGRVVKKYTCLTSATSISISLHLSLLMITSSRSVDHGIGSLLNPWTSVTFLPLFCSSRMASRGLFFFFSFFLLQIFCSLTVCSFFFALLFVFPSSFVLSSYRFVKDGRFSYSSWKRTLWNRYPGRARSRARFVLIFAPKSLKTAQKLGARVYKTHVWKEKRMTVVDRRWRFQFICIPVIKPFVRTMCLYLEKTVLDKWIEMHIFDPLKYRDTTETE